MSYTWRQLPDYDLLSSLLDEMDIPEVRKDLTKKANIRWLDRNLTIRNKGPSADKAMGLIKSILKEKRNV